MRRRVVVQHRQARRLLLLVGSAEARLVAQGRHVVRLTVVQDGHLSDGAVSRSRRLTRTIVRRLVAPRARADSSVLCAHGHLMRIHIRRVLRVLRYRGRQHARHLLIQPLHVLTELTLIVCLGASSLVDLARMLVLELQRAWLARSSFDHGALVSHPTTVLIEHRDGTVAGADLA